MHHFVTIHEAGMRDFLCLLSGFLTVSAGFLAEDSKLVETSKGKISGFQRTSRDGRAYWAWMKIPFAKPPVGKLRLAAPEPEEGWEGILNATKPPPACQQVYLSPAASTMSEDCLYLNVYRPRIDRKPLPVLFYIFGGGFVYGYSGSIEFSEYLMDEDVVLVTPNYRLGALGFLSMNHTAFPGNYGVKDQARAVKWVKENIESFGGDPNSITVFGESAGAASAQLLLLSPLTRDIVSRSVSISGVISMMWSLKTPEQVAEGNRLLANELGCSQNDPTEVLECLRELSPSKFVEQAGKSSQEGLSPLAAPVIEPEGPGAFAPTDLRKVESTKPMILSYAAGEYKLAELREKMMGNQVMKTIAKDTPSSFILWFINSTLKVDDERLIGIAEKCEALYFNSSDAEKINHGFGMMLQDVAFVYPVLSAAELHKGPVWLYHFEYRGEFTLLDMMLKQDSTTEASHGDELFLLFNWRKFYPRSNKQRPRKKDVRKSKEFIKYIVNFAYLDNPTPEGSGLPTWEPYKGNEILRIKNGQNEMADSNFVKEQKNIQQFFSELLCDFTSYWV